MFGYGCFINGGWAEGRGGRFTTVNPARPDITVGEYTAAAPEDLIAAAKAAAAAQKDWQALPSVGRGQAVGMFLDALTARTTELAASITLEQGKPIAEATAEVRKSIQEARFMAGEAARGEGKVVPSARPGIRNLVTRRPRGVIAAITPWNFPILTPMRKIAPALVFGNAIILKPSEYTPATACLIAEASKGILPDGLLQVVPGGAEVGSALVRLPQVAGVTFTGSVATGREIYRMAAETLAEISLELGGKNAAIIHDTDDLDACLDQITGAAFMCAGQRCTAISRVVVRDELKAEVLDGLVARARKVALGDGMVEGTTMGPLTNANQLKRVDRMVQAGIAEGAKALDGGEPARLQGLDGGYFYGPTILAEVRPEMSVAREEIFGPVISVLDFRTLGKGLAILNGVEYGLTSALFSNDNSVIQRFIEESETGMLHVNHGTVPDNHMPFGGIKNSGVGAYSVGASAINFYTTEHSVYVKHA